MPSTVKVGVLAFQGAFAEHRECLEKAGHLLKKQGRLGGLPLEVVEVKWPCDLCDLHGLILPGGESTTMSKFLQRNHFMDDLRSWMKGVNGYRPLVWGTCAGLILLSDRLMETKQGGQATIGGLGITSTRNRYGRQTDSFESPLELHEAKLQEGLTDCQKAADVFMGVFIRAPGIHSIDRKTVKILARLQDDTQSVVGVEEGNLMATAFHPELTNDLRWHGYFLQRIYESLEGPTGH